MRHSLIATVVFTLCGFTAQVQASQTIYYPTQDQVEFSLVAPDGWKLDPAEEEGGFFDLNGPTGALVSMRTITATKEDVADAMKDTMSFIEKSYSGVTMEKGKSSDTTYSASGTGKDKKDGHEVTFMMLWTAINDHSVIEIWAAVDVGDKAGGDAARKILNSMKIP